MLKRRISKQISIGNVKIGGGAPVSVQTMCNTDTRDIEATLKQIKEFEDAGCEIVRLAVLNKDAAEAIKEIVKNTVKTLIDRPKLIRLALLTSYSYTLYQIYGIVYFFN